MAVAVEVEERRRALRVLDSCLDALEEAHARDETALSPELSDRLRRHVPGVTAGMPIAEGMRRVFELQTSYLRTIRGDRRPGAPRGRLAVLRGFAPDAGPRSDPGADSPAPSAQDSRARGLLPEPLEEEEARTLTERIKAANRECWLLLLEAHQRRAWLALGYPSWDQYVHRELGMSRSRSYEILDQARVASALQAAVGMSAIPDISPYAARQVKSHLDELLATVRRRVQGASPDSLPRIVADAVRQQRASASDLKVMPAAPSRGRELVALLAATEALASAVPARELVAGLTADQARALARCQRSLQWLGEVVAESQCRLAGERC